MRNGILLILLAMLVASPALGFKTSKYSEGNGSVVYTLCDADDEAGGGVCDNADSLDLGANVMGYSNLGFSSSGAGTYTCTMHAGDASVLNSSDLSSVGSPIGGANLTDTNPKFNFSGAEFAAVWMTCSANAGGSVTVYVQMGN